MPDDAPTQAGNPQYSIIIAVYNDWGPLEQCLLSLERQTNAPDFEVIVVDDGSKQPAPDIICRRKVSYSLTIVQQPHQGIAAARNRGLQSSNGSVMVFTDADCRFQADCLSALEAALAHSPHHSCFQLNLKGDCSNLLGRAEELRLTEIQKQKMQPNGTIRYVNTAGFAIRRTRVDTRGGLFNPAALRSEDTLLLVDLIQRGELPCFVAGAVVQHVVSRSLLECLRKDFHAAWLEAKTFEIIAAKGVQVRMSYRARVRMLFSMWNTAGSNSIGRGAWFVVVARQSVQRIITVGYRCSRIRAVSRTSAGAC